MALSTCAGCYVRVNEGFSQMSVCALCRCLGMITSLVQVQWMLRVATQVEGGGDVKSSFLGNAEISTSCLSFTCLKCFCVYDRIRDENLLSDNIPPSQSTRSQLGDHF